MTKQSFLDKYLASHPHCTHKVAEKRWKRYLKNGRRNYWREK